MFSLATALIQADLYAWIHESINPPIRGSVSLSPLASGTQQDIGIPCIRPLHQIVPPCFLSFTLFKTWFLLHAKRTVSIWDCTVLPASPSTSREESKGRHVQQVREA
jgi:hypothetical protein